jgi:hypothetical protein
VKPKIDLDTSNLIDLEHGRPAAVHVRRLKQLHDGGRVVLRLIAASASERQPDGSSLSTFKNFTAWVEKLGLGDLAILMPIFIWDITYWGFCSHSRAHFNTETPGPIAKKGNGMARSLGGRKVELRRAPGASPRCPASNERREPLSGPQESVRDVSTSSWTAEEAAHS